MRILLIIMALMTPLAALAQTVSAAMDGVLILRSDDGRDRFLGSAFVFGDATTAVTNEHVVGDFSKVVAATQDGRRIAARVVKRDAALDLAVLELSEPIDHVLAPAGAVEPGVGVFAAGAPLEAGFSLTAGIVSALERQIDPQQPVLYLQHSAPVNPGSSGGPLLDARGRVVGINTRIADGSRFFVGIAYAIPVQRVSRYLKEGETRSVAPGLQVRPITARIKSALGHHGQGVLVEHVIAGGPAAKAGLVAGDILLTLAGREISTPGDIALALEGASTQITARVLREMQEIRLTLDLMPAARPLTPMRPSDIETRTSYTLAEMGIDLNDDGLIVAMAEDGVGFFAGLSPDDRIIAINGRKTDTMEDGWSNSFLVTKPVLLLIALPDGTTQHYVLDPWDTRKGFRPSSGANILDQEVVSFE